MEAPGTGDPSAWENPVLQDPSPDHAEQAEAPSVDLGLQELGLTGQQSSRKIHKAPRPLPALRPEHSSPWDIQGKMSPGVKMLAAGSQRNEMGFSGREGQS